MAFMHFEPTSISQWYALLKDTLEQTGKKLDDSVESYVILTLDHYAKDASWTNATIAIEFLETVSALPQSHEKLRSVGDRCLILSGLFPERAKKVNVSTRYYIDIGQQAYLFLSDNTHLKYDPKLFAKLGHHFGELAHLLQHMRLLTRTVQ